MKTMLFLCKFLFRNLKDYRFLVVLAMLMTCAQVGSDLLTVMPLKFIVSKISNPGSDPSCTFPFLDGLLTVFSLLMLAVFGLLNALLIYAELFLSTFIAQHLSARLREQLFDHLQRLSMDWHDG